MTAKINISNLGNSLALPIPDYIVNYIPERGHFIRLNSAPRNRVSAITFVSQPRDLWRNPVSSETGFLTFNFRQPAPHHGNLLQTPPLTLHPPLNRIFQPLLMLPKPAYNPVESP